jgi:hypothetical protein
LNAERDERSLAAVLRFASHGVRSVGDNDLGLSRSLAMG